jgi:hypothetical protein
MNENETTTEIVTTQPGALAAPSQLATALAAKETAAIQARYALARRFPRSVANFRVDLLAEADRLTFAETAEYARPVGKELNKETGRWEEKIARGPSIRLIEAGLRLYSNVSTEVVPLHDDARSRSVRVEVTDLQTCVSFSTTISFEKTEERSSLKDGQEAISRRKNSHGKDVYIVVATDDRVRVKEAALVSKAIRDQGRRVLPADVIEEVILKCRDRLAHADKEDPGGARKRVVDAFATVGVKPTDLIEYLGGAPLEGLRDTDLAHLRGLVQAMREGLHWPDALAGSPYLTSEPKEGEKPNPAITKAREAIDRAQQKLAKKATAKDAPPETKPATPDAKTSVEDDAEARARAEAEALGGGS